MELTPLFNPGTINDAIGGDAATAAKNLKNQKKVDGASKDFESVFLSQMLSQMFDNVDIDPEFGGGSAEDIYRSMLVEQYGKAIADKGGLGIADSVKQQLLKVQELQGK